MRQSSRVLWPLLLCSTTWILPAVAQKCYTPAGKDRNQMFNESTGSMYAPCNKTAKHSMCCSIGPNGSGDTCLSNGLCSNTNGYAPIWWRESCTDPTWKDPACIKLFVNGTGLAGSEDSTTGVNDADDVQITFCPNRSWCYGFNYKCCDAGEGFFVGADGNQTRQNPNPTITSGTSVMTAAASANSMTHTQRQTTSSGLAVETASLNPNTHHELSTGTKVGIGVGVAIAVVLLAGIVIALLWFWRHRRSRSQGVSKGWIWRKTELPGSNRQAWEIDSHPKTVFVYQGTKEKPIELGG